ncbi:hypothetical protein FB451DRAFT_1393701 [Mycena latifolia]|nr:hypothetical protein FB451DRAFT_1393701 [Mycena latifolia]
MLLPSSAHCPRRAASASDVYVYSGTALHVTRTRLVVTRIGIDLVDLSVRIRLFYGDRRKAEEGKHGGRVRGAEGRDSRADECERGHSDTHQHLRQRSNSTTHVSPASIGTGAPKSAVMPRLLTRPARPSPCAPPRAGPARHPSPLSTSPLRALRASAAAVSPPASRPRRKCTTSGSATAASAPSPRLHKRLTTLEVASPYTTSASAAVKADLLAAQPQLAGADAQLVTAQAQAAELDTVQRALCAREDGEAAVRALKAEVLVGKTTLASARDDAARGGRDPRTTRRGPRHSTLTLESTRPSAAGRTPCGHVRRETPLAGKMELARDDADKLRRMVVGPDPWRSLGARDAEVPTEGETSYGALEQHLSAVRVYRGQMALASPCADRAPYPDEAAAEHKAIESTPRRWGVARRACACAVYELTGAYPLQKIPERELRNGDELVPARGVPE